MIIKTIKEKVINQIIIEKSKFITYLLPCFSKQEALKNLDEIKGSHPEANHFCYGYIINENNNIFYKSSDDKEPANTAGMPILNTLRNNDLANILCVVVRYFGGIKLGAGGLTRAYSNSASSALNKAIIITLQEAFIYDINFTYEINKEVENILKNNNIKILKKNYEETITYSILIFNEEEFMNLLKKYAYLCIIYQKMKITLASN